MRSQTILKEIHQSAFKQVTGVLYAHNRASRYKNVIKLFLRCVKGNVTNCIEGGQSLLVTTKRLLEPNTVQELSAISLVPCKKKRTFLITFSWNRLNNRQELCV